METIYKKFKDGYSANSYYGIDFYNEHLLFFNNITHFNNQQEFIMFVEMFDLCVESFTANRQYKNAIAALEMLPTIESAIDQYKIDRAKFTFYRRLLFQKAFSLYYLKDFKSATKLFRQLQDDEPQNDLIKSWIGHNKLRRIGQFIYVPILIALVCIVIERITKNNQYMKLNHIATLIGSISLATFFGMFLYVQLKSYRKSQR